MEDKVEPLKFVMEKEGVVGTMAISPFLPTLSSSSSSLFIFLLLVVVSSSPSPSPSPVPISDEEMGDKKQACYADIDSGLWGEKCRWSMIDKENCALRCLSRVCYDLIYDTDPLEEGERDHVRSQEYRYCIRRVSVGLNIDAVKGTFGIQFEVNSPSMSLPGSVRLVRRN